MNSNTKSYESYQMLAKLLNSERKENIDKAYNALLAALNESYGEKEKSSSDEYKEKKNTLAKNKAKAEKYLGYFMTEKGYDNSGIEADAKNKAQIAYNADMAALDREEERSKAALEAKRREEAAKNEAERAKQLGKADADLEDQLNKLKKEQDKTDVNREKLELEKYLKEKEIEYKNVKEHSASGGGTDSEKLNAYRYLTYKSMVEKAQSMTDKYELAAFYDSVTGANTEQATEILGFSNYRNLIKEIENRQKALKEEEESEEMIKSLYSLFVSRSGREYHGVTYRRLAGDLKADKIGTFTKKQLDEAYDRYKNDLDNGLFKNGN